MKTRHERDWLDAVHDFAALRRNDETEETLLLLGKTGDQFARAAEHVRTICFQQDVLAELRAIREALERRGRTMIGRIVHVNLAKRFGFITVPTGGDDAFFHADDLCDGLEFDQQLQERHVEYELTNHPRGPRARSVRPAP